MKPMGHSRNIDVEKIGLSGPVHCLKVNRDPSPVNALCPNGFSDRRWLRSGGTEEL